MKMKKSTTVLLLMIMLPDFWLPSTAIRCYRCSAPRNKEDINVCGGNLRGEDNEHRVYDTICDKYCALHLFPGHSDDEISRTCPAFYDQHPDLTPEDIPAETASYCRKNRAGNVECICNDADMCNNRTLAYYKQKSPVKDMSGASLQVPSVILLMTALFLTLYQHLNN